MQTLLIFCFIVLLLSSNLLLAQTDTLADVFPMAIGNQWTYRYYTDSGLNGSTFWQETDSGQAIYRVVAKFVSADSTRWAFARYRTMTRHQTVNAWDTTYQIRDTTAFELIERNNGAHQIHRNSTIQEVLDIFPFTRDYTDTTMIFRYRRLGPSDTIRFVSRRPGSYSPFHRSLFTFRRGVGVVRYKHDHGILDAWANADHYLLSHVITSVDGGEKPSGISLSQNYPNPFNPSTTMNISLPTQSDFTLTIYDVLGREVKSFGFERVSAGKHQITWDGNDAAGSAVASGVYLYQLEAGNVLQTKKLMLLR